MRINKIKPAGDKSIKLQFTCPNDGVVLQDLVSFLCNRCGSKMKKIGDSYLCPECLKPNAKFECRLCNSKAVKMKVIKAA